MKRKIIIRSMSMFIVMLASLWFAFFAKGFYKPSNSDRYHTIEDLQKSDIPVGDQYVAAYFDGYEDVTAEEITKQFVDALSEFSAVMLVKPTGNIKCQYWSIRQEVTVKTVLKGEASEGEQIYCIFQGARVETDAEGIRLKTYGVNLMQPEKEYLLFCDRADMSDYAEEEYYVNAPGICYFAMDDNWVGGVNSSEVRYADIAGCEFFVNSEKAAEAAEKFKKEIMEYFVTGEDSLYRGIN